MTVSVSPDTMDGSASGTRTFLIICQFVEPMARAACTIPSGTSLSADSVTRAMKGAAANDSGIIVGAVPTTVLRTSLVNGSITIMRITNGNERKTSMTRLRTMFSMGCGVIPRSAVALSRMPSGNPIITANIVEKKTIASVCSVDVPTSMRICSIFHLPPKLPAPFFCTRTPLSFSHAMTASISPSLPEMSASM